MLTSICLTVHFPISRETTSGALSSFHASLGRVTMQDDYAGYVSLLVGLSYHYLLPQDS